MQIILLIGLLVGFGVAHADEPLDPALHSVLEAAYNSENPDDFPDAVRILSLTQSAESLSLAAGLLPGEAQTQVHQLLGLPTPQVPTPIDSEMAAPESAIVLDTEINPAHRDSVEAIRLDRRVMALPRQIVTQLAEGELDLWTGRARIGLQIDQGNTNNQEYNFGLDVERVLAGWGFKSDIDYAYKETNDTIGRDQLQAKVRGKREAGDRWTLFSQVEYDQDQLSSNDFTAFASAGFGYRALSSEITSWILRASPGIRFIEPMGEKTETTASGSVSSEYRRHLSPEAVFQANSSLIFPEASRAEQTFSLTNSLGHLWALELSYRYRHDFEVEDGFNESDSRTRISVTRKF